MSLALEAKFSRVGNRVVVAVDGDLDVHAAPALRRVLADVIDDQGNLFVDVDLSGVKFLDAAALRVLVGQRKTLEARGGVLALAGVRPNLYRVLEVTRLASYFTIRSGHPARSARPGKSRSSTAVRSNASVQPRSGWVGHASSSPVG